MAFPDTGMVFHENYDKTKPYVDKETMNRKFEWFISSVFDHYFGKLQMENMTELFYGWDVVNEAVIGNSYQYRYRDVQRKVSMDPSWK